jgi:DNA-binding MarR family transcriptional regulator
MKDDPDSALVAEALLVGLRLCIRRVKALQAGGDLTLPEQSALSRLRQSGPATSTALAKLEQISPQSMGATLAGLEARGLVQRTADPDDGRRVVLSVSGEGEKLLNQRRSHRAEQVAAAMAGEFTPDELRQLLEMAPLIERLGQAL